MITKIVQYLGVLFIVIFCAISIFFSLSQRELESSSLKDIMFYTSFFEDRFYDLRMNLTQDKSEVDKRIVLAAIDDNSLTKIGRWPWTRSIWKEVIDKLQIYGAKVIAFDVFFSEPEKACSAESPDKIMAKAIRDFQLNPDKKIIVPYSLTDDPSGDFPGFLDAMIEHIMTTEQPGGGQLKRKYVDKNIFPIKELAETGMALGHIGVQEDPDGIFRHYPVVANIFTEDSDFYFPSFALVAYELYTGKKTTVKIYVHPDQKENNIEQSLVLDKKENSQLNLNYRGEAKVRWLGGRGHFPETTLYEILKTDPNDQKMKDLIKDNIIFIGSTAFAAHDLRHTPVDSMLPGIFFHMNMTHMLLEGKFFAPGQKSTIYSWIILLSGTLLILIVMLFGHAILDLLTVNLIVVAFFILDTYYLLPRGYEIKLFFCLLSPIACYSWTTFLHFYLASKEKKYIKGTFSRFVAPAIVNQMLDNPDKVKIGGEKKNITVFFSDVRDFTNISEKLTPEELSICLNQYMGVMTDILFDHYGTLDKYIGDAIVAYWGAPIHVENHAYHAVKASLLMIDAIPGINERFREQGFPEFQHGIGLNTGDCSVGNMGSDKIFSYTALGDNMNLGARVEALCKFYGVQLNITEYTKDALSEELQKEFTFRILDKVKVKGKERPVILWEVLHDTHDFKTDPQALKTYSEAFFAYQNKDFQKALDLLAPLCEKYPKDKSCKRVSETCQGFINNPPGEDWDGVYTHTSK